MKSVFLLLALLFMIYIQGFSKQWTIINSGFEFSPSTLTISLGDTVNFTLESVHTVREVSQTTWSENGTTALSGGFQLSFGGGVVLPAKLQAGTHYYVCVPHASFGMKGTIIVQNFTGLAEKESKNEISVFPNPFTGDFSIRATTKQVGATYMILDQIGKQVLAGKLDDETTSVNLDRFSNGLYILQIGNDRNKSIKLIKRQAAN